MVADIEKAFLMIPVSPKDRDVLRFLWVDDVFKENPDIVRRHCQTPVYEGSLRCLLEPLLVKCHGQASSREVPPVTLRFSKVLTQSMYMDDECQELTWRKKPILSL